jgi:molybdenum cofactor cytidylyltransferase
VTQDKQAKQTLDAPRLRIGAVLLAAGSASRMGQRPKCLLELEGQALIVRQLHALLALQERVVVLGHHAQAIEPVLAGLDIAFSQVHNPNPQAGQISSLHVGLSALSPELDAVLVALADQPLIGSADIDDLVEAYRNRPAGVELVQPSVQGLPGNPVIFSQAVRQQILAGGPALGCRQWQQAHPQQVHAWPSDNLAYRTDVDTPEDLVALAERTGHRLLWPTGLAGEPASGAP